MKIIRILFILISFNAMSQKGNAVDSLLNIGRYQGALAILEDSSDGYEKFLKMGRIYNQVDQTEKAIGYFEQAKEQKSEYQVYIELAKAYRKLRDYKNAIRYYELILEQDPDNLLMSYQLGKLYLLQRRPSKAITVFKMLETKDRLNPNFPYQRARAYAMQKERDSMIDTFLIAYQIDTTHIKSIYQLANSFFKLREQDSTRLFIKTGLILDPKHQNLLRLKANQEFLLKDYESSIKTLHLLDSFYPNTKFTNSMLGKSYFNSGNLKQAEKYLNKAKGLDPNDYKTLTNLGHVAMKKGELERARRNYLMATVIGKQRLSEEYFGLGNVYVKQEEILRAIKMFEKARDDNPGDYKILFQLAKTSDEYYNDKKKVYKYYREYVFRFPNVDKVMTNYANRRIKDIKKQYFVKGESLAE